MWTRKFWIAATERAIKTAAQALLGLWIGQSVVNLWDINFKQAVGVAIGAMILSYLTSLVSMPVGGNGPSVTHVENLT